MSYLDLPNLTLFSLVSPRIISSHLISSHLILSYLILSELISYYLNLSYTILSHTILSHAHILLSLLLPLTIDEFESRCSALIARLQVCVLQCLEESGLDKSQLSEVEIVGQSHHVLPALTAMPCHSIEQNRRALIIFHLV